MRRGRSRYLEQLRVRAEGVGARVLLISVLALEAVALEELGRRAAARAALLRALDLSAARRLRPRHPRRRSRRRPAAAPPGPGTDPHARYQPGLSGLCLPAAGRGRAGRPAAAPRPGPDPAPTPAPRNPAAPLLTSRELAIVRLLETGYSNQEIADRLIIGVSTVKWYLREIYEKLGSTNRTQAVARARALRLLH